MELNCFFYFGGGCLLFDFVLFSNCQFVFEVYNNFKY